MIDCAEPLSKEKREIKVVAFRLHRTRSSLCIEKSSKDQNQIKQLKLPKSSARVLGALTSLYEHEDRNTPVKSGSFNNNEVELSRTRGVRTRQFVLVGIVRAMIILICICSVLGSRILPSQKNCKTM